VPVGAAGLSRPGGGGRAGPHPVRATRPPDRPGLRRPAPWARRGPALRVQISEITGGGGKATGVRLAEGRHVPSGAVAAGIGITPNSQLTAAASPIAGVAG
jgi:hypothetical protein